MDVGSRIRDLCNERNIKSMYELSKLSKVPQSTLQSILNGVSPKTDTLEKICSGLKITMAEFFADDPEALTELRIQSMPRELRKIIEQEDFTLNGRLASPEDKQKLIAVYEAMYWDAKEQNKKARAAAKAKKEESKE